MLSFTSTILLVLSVIALCGQTDAATIPGLLSARQPTGNLLTLDLCRATEDCARPDGGFNFCFSVNRGAIGAICSKDLPTCRCIPEVRLAACTASDTSACLDGEVCVSYTPGTSGPLAVIRAGRQLDDPFCASAEAEKELSDVELVSSSGSEPSGTETVIDLTTPFSTGGNLTFDTCREQVECVNPGIAALCLSFNSGFVGEACTDEIPTCRCQSALRTCEKDGDCIVGEVCVIYTKGREGPLLEISSSFEDLDSETPFCVSEGAEKRFIDLERYNMSSPPAKPTGEGPVIDAVTPVRATGGTSLSSCRTNDDCMSTFARKWNCQAFDLGNVGGTCIDAKKCRCLPRISFRRCTDNSFCMVGEGCVRFVGERGTEITQISDLDFTRPFCMSLDAVKELDVELLATPSPAPPSTAPPSTVPPSGGSDPEKEDNPIAGSDPDKEDNPSGGSDAEKEDNPSEDTTNEGMNNETEDSGNDGSEDDADEEGGGAEGEPTDSEVCVDAQVLSHLSPDNLVFKKHVLAKVLCDAEESCATPGHMVIFRGQAMRMSAYCHVRECYKRKMYVNSPRYGRSMRIQSRTDGLEFTAFAARFDTRAEEIALAAAVKLGL